MNDFHTSWLEINEEHLEHNIEVFRNLIDDTTKLGVVLKSNAYGHGFAQVLEAIHPLVDIIHVITPEDAFYIRNYEMENNFNQVRVLVLGPVTREHIPVCAQHDIELTLYGHDWDNLLSGHSHNTKIKVHLHIDTGLNREGFPTQSNEIQTLLKKHEKSIELIGVMSHFANTEDVTEQEYAKFQLDNFNKFISDNKLKVERHIGASAATLILKDSHFNAIRIGISLYGMWPSKETQLSYNSIKEKDIEFKPVMSWKVKSQVVKTIPAGSFVGYGCVHKTEKETRIAVLPIGYYDGYPRILSGKAYVLVNGQRCPVIGRIMMNHIVVDATNVAKDNSRIEATLLGIDGKEQITAENLANWSDTINYEVTTRVGGHLPRLLI